VKNSLENLSKMKNSDCLIEKNTFNSQDKHHTCEESKYKNIQVSAADVESFHSPSHEQIPECSNKPKHTDTTITTAHCVKNQEHKRDSDILPTDNKPSPEDYVITIIKNHQEAIW
jgi:hypothetical protein